MGRQEAAERHDMRLGNGNGVARLRAQQFRHYCDCKAAHLQRLLPRLLLEGGLGGQDEHAARVEVWVRDPQAVARGLGAALYKVYLAPAKRDRLQQQQQEQWRTPESERAGERHRGKRRSKGENAGNA